MKDWKSTATGVLSFLITTLTIISAFLGGNDLSAGGGIATIHAPARLTAGISIALALCRAYLGIITKNADATAVAHAINNVADVGPGALPSTTASLTTAPKEP